MKRRHTILLAAVVMLALRIAFPFLQTAHQMREYLRIVNPHFAPHAKLFSSYDPVGDAFYMRITDDSDASISLECVSDGLIIDEIRTDKYLETHSISTRSTADDKSVGHLACYWKYNAPEEPMFLLSLRGDRSLSVTSEAQLKETMKSWMLTHYEQLPDIVAERLFRCHTAHQTDSAMYRITIFTNAEDDFESLVAQAEMTKEELG